MKRTWRFAVPWWWIVGVGMVVLTWTVTAVMAVSEAWKTSELGTTAGYIAPVNLFAVSYLIIAFYMMLCWTRAVLEQRRASVTCDDTGIEIVDWRNVRLSIPWADVRRGDYGGFCKPPRVVVYAEGNLAHEFSPWLVSPRTLLECLIERASLNKGARTWSRQFWSSPAGE